MNKVILKPVKLKINFKSMPPFFYSNTFLLQNSLISLFSNYVQMRVGVKPCFKIFNLSQFKKWWTAFGLHMYCSVKFRHLTKIITKIGKQNVITLEFCGVCRKQQV